MKSLFLIFVCLLVFVLPSRPAKASIWIEGAFTALRTSDDAQGVAKSDFRFLNTATFGYSALQGFLLGIQYLGSASTGNHERSWAWGPKGGLLIKGFELTAAYLPSGRDFSGNVARTGGGYAINLGYTYPIWGVFEVGLYGVYWSMTYVSAQVDGEASVDLSEKQHRSTLAPMLSVAFQF
ncbi:hypothetical protein WDW86_09385 [Bdellovibrionota bacterium FG-2]